MVHYICIYIYIWCICRLIYEFVSVHSDLTKLSDMVEIVHEHIPVNEATCWFLTCCTYYLLDVELWWQFLSGCIDETNAWLIGFEIYFISSDYPEHEGFLRNRYVLGTVVTRIYPWQFSHTLLGENKFRNTEKHSTTSWGLNDIFLHVNILFHICFIYFANDIYLDHVPLYIFFHRYIPNSVYYNKIHLQMPSAECLSYCSGPTEHKIRNLLAVLDIHIDKAKFLDTPALEWHCVQVAPAFLPRFRICSAKYFLGDHIWIA